MCRTANDIFSAIELKQYHGLVSIHKPCQAIINDIYMNPFNFIIISHMSRDFEIDNAMKMIRNVRALCACVTDLFSIHSNTKSIWLRASLCTRGLESRSWSEIVRLWAFSYIYQSSGFSYLCMGGARGGGYQNVYDDTFKTYVVQPVQFSSTYPTL